MISLIVPNVLMVSIMRLLQKIYVLQSAKLGIAPLLTIKDKVSAKNVVMNVQNVILKMKIDVLDARNLISLLMVLIVLHAQLHANNAKISLVKSVRKVILDNLLEVVTQNALLVMLLDNLLENA